MKTSILFGAALGALLILSGGDAEARRFRSHTSYPDKETEIFCKANPDQCESKIDWASSIGGTVLGTAILTGLRSIFR
jgi:hypothetical protein